MTTDMVLRHANGVSTIAVMPEGKHVVSGGRENVLRKHDLRTGMEVCSGGLEEDVWVARYALTRLGRAERK